MAIEADSTDSVWQATVEMPKFEPLTANLTADVCVVGAGIAGLSTAYMLARSGKRVVVLEKGEIGSGQTGLTTAHISNAIDDRYYNLEIWHGRNGSRMAASSFTAVINTVEEIVQREQIDCNFERLDGYLFVPPDNPISELRRELAAARRAGLTNVELVERAPIKDFDTRVALRFSDQAQFHPLKYLAGLAQAITRYGGHIFTNTYVQKVISRHPALVRTRTGGTVRARAVVLATNSPVNNVFDSESSNDPLIIHTKQAPYRTFVIGARVPKGSVTRALYWDTIDPYHYVRVADGKDPSYDVLVVGGEDERSGQSDDAESRYAWLETWARERWPMMQEIEFRWSGQVQESIDGLGFIGRDLSARNIFIATGDSGMGMSNGTLAGIILSDLTSGRRNSWANLYNPARFRFSTLPEFAREGVNIAQQYLSWLAPADLASTRDIERGEGAIIRRGLAKIAVYRDDEGRLHKFNAACTHQLCPVAWDSAEGLWRCPCHGSAFDPTTGAVVNGPAITGLDPAND